MNGDWKIIAKAVILAAALIMGLELEFKPTKPQINYHLVIITTDTTTMPLDFLETIGSMLFGSGMGMVGQKWSALS